MGSRPPVETRPRILVTGATGFIGRPLCERLLETGYAVRAIVRHDSQLLPDIETCSVARIDGDTEWESLLEGIDAVIHLAARVHRLHDTATDSEDAYRQVNTVGTLRLAEAAAAAGCRRFVFFSTVKVLGEGGAFDGNAAGRSPEDPYGRSKFEAEVGLRNLSASTGMEVVCIRPPLVYGPGVKANFLRLMNWVHRGVPLPLSSVENRRSLVYVGNLVDAAIRCLSSERIPGFAYSVTDGEDISTANLIRSIAGAMGKSATLFPCPVGLLRCAGTIAGKGAEVRRLTESLTVSDAAFRRDFGWTPPFTMQEGIQETVNWFLSNRR